MAFTVIPSKLVSKGVGKAKNKIKKEVNMVRSRAKAMIAVTIVFNFFLLFSSITVALAINHYYHSRLLGFIILAVFYFLIFLTLILVKRRVIIKFFQNI